MSPLYYSIEKRSNRNPLKSCPLITTKEFVEKNRIDVVIIGEEYKDLSDKKWYPGAFELNNYKYISPVDISPKIGPQGKADAYTGMCLTFSLIYLQLRIMNPEVEQTEVVKYILKKSKNKKYRQQGYCKNHNLC